MNQTQFTTEAIWKLLSEKLRNFLRQQVSDDSLADDLLQETFIRIHRGVPYLKDPERMSSWVFRIARNVMVDHFRRKHPAEQVQNEPEILTEHREETNLNAQAAECVLPLLSSLPEKYRDALEFFELHGRSHREIAARLGLSLSGAKSRVQRGREKLKETLLRCCHVEFDRRGNVIDFEPRPLSCRSCIGEYPVNSASCQLSLETYQRG